eukprot:gene23947-10074_t
MSRFAYIDTEDTFNRKWDEMSMGRTEQGYVLVSIHRADPVVNGAQSTKLELPTCRRIGDALPKIRQKLGFDEKAGLHMYEIMGEEVHLGKRVNVNSTPQQLGWRNGLEVFVSRSHGRALFTENKHASLPMNMNSLFMQTVENL